ncbi:MAG: hypothetical protein QOE90_1214 [Thermoplasmata archaeon]|jgi:hypothetical protein|nr:hypothetical protein [Thermoplasmata archaeon]
MRAGAIAWRIVELAVPAALVMLSVALLAAAVGAMLLNAPRATQWALFAEGMLCWVGGLAWGWLANGRRAS